MSLPTNFFIGRGGGQQPLITPTGSFVLTNENNGADEYLEFSVGTNGSISSVSEVISSVGDVDRIMASTMSANRVVYMAAFAPRLSVIDIAQSNIRVLDTRANAFNNESYLAPCGLNSGQFLSFTTGGVSEVLSFDLNYGLGSQRDSIQLDLGNYGTSTGNMKSSSALKAAGQDRAVIAHGNKVQFVDTADLTNLSKSTALTMSAFSNYGFGTLCYTDDPNVMAHISYSSSNSRTGAAFQVEFIDVSGTNPTSLGSDSIASRRTPSVFNSNSMHGPWAYYGGGNTIVTADEYRMRFYKLNTTTYGIDTYGSSADHSTNGFNMSEDIHIMWANENIFAVIGENYANGSQARVITYGLNVENSTWFNSSQPLANTTKTLNSSWHHTSSAPFYDLP